MKAFLSTGNSKNCSKFFHIPKSGIIDLYVFHIYIYISQYIISCPLVFVCVCVCVWCAWCVCMYFVYVSYYVVQAGHKLWQTAALAFQVLELQVCHTTICCSFIFILFYVILSDLYTVSPMNIV